MKAVILAGGRGERLRPITDTRPKPLVPVLARPVMDYCLSLLAHHGVKEAYVTTHYLADQIRHRYGKEAFGMALSYSQEETPLGTAGGVKILEEHLKGEKAFLVMSGDALCDFDLTRALLFHQEKNADVTIVLSSVKTPLEYGVVLSDTFEKIFAFAEKPDWSETFSDLVNTGVYIISPHVLDRIPQGKTFDFSQDLFPLLLKEGYRLFGYKDEGYWCDIGKIPTLYRCNLDVMQGRAKTYLPPEGRVVTSADGAGCYFVSNGARVDEGAEIRTGSVISSGVHLARGSRVSGSLVLEQAKLEKGALSQDAVLCEQVTLREDAVAMPGSVLGAGSAVMPKAATTPGKKYPPFSVLTRLPPFQEDSLVFTEKGASSGSVPGLDGKGSEDLGCAFARSFSKNIAVVWDEKEKKSAYFASLFAGGVIRGGKSAFLLGEGTYPMASFGASVYRLPTVFVTVSGGRGMFFGYEEDGFPLLRKDTIRLARFHGEESAEGEGSILIRENLEEKYLLALCAEMGKQKGRALGLGGTSSRLLKEAAIRSGLHAYDRTREKGLSLEIFDRGFKIFWNGEKLADTEKARLFVIEEQMKQGRRSFLLPDSAPKMLAEHIENRGGKVLFFSMGQTCENQMQERNRGEKERWLFDHNFLAARVLFHLNKMEEEQIPRAFRATPDIFISQLRYIPKDENKAKILGRAPREANGVHTRVRIHPGFYGIRIVSEATSFEAALDHAFEYRGKLNEIEKNIGGR